MWLLDSFEETFVVSVEMNFSNVEFTVKMQESDRLVIGCGSEKAPYVSQHLPKTWPKALVGIQGLSREQCEKLEEISKDRALKKKIWGNLSSENGTIGLFRHSAPMFSWMIEFADKYFHGFSDEYDESEGEFNA